MDISLLPHFSDLAKDYLTSFTTSPIKEFFPRPPSIDELEGLLAERVAQYPSETRTAIADLIESQHRELGTLTPTVQANIELLRNENTLAVVTGQQVGILGGPLYTFYKTYTTIALAKVLAARYPDHRFVPIFWLETEDHDLEEASSVMLLDQQGEPHRASYAPTGVDVSDWKKQVGPTKLDAEALEAFFTQFEAGLQRTEITDVLLQELKSIYTSERTFAEAFAIWLSSTFGDDGLLVLDANNARAKQLGSALFTREIETSPKLSEQVVLQTARLEEHYHAQVKPRAINLFYVENGERHAIMEREKPADDGSKAYFLKGTKRVFTQAQLLEIASSSPEKLSPNVVMRPLLQDTLLPTVAYVAGPGEVAYFAQLKRAYEWAGIAMPVIYPRLTATIIEDRHQKSLDKAGADVHDLLISGKAAIDRIIDNMTGSDLESQFANADTAIDAELEKLRIAVAGVDGSLDNALTSVKGKVLTTLRDFSAKVQSADRKRHQTVRTQLEKALQSILPQSDLQERKLSAIYFSNKYGRDLVSGLKQATERDVLKTGEHHLYLASALVKLGARNSSEGGENLRTSEREESFMAVPNEEIAS